MIFFKSQKTISGVYNNTGANGLNDLLTNLATAMISSGRVSGLLKNGSSTITSGLSGNSNFVSWLNNERTAKEYVGFAFSQSAVMTLDFNVQIGLKVTYKLDD